MIAVDGDIADGDIFHQRSGAGQSCVERGTDPGDSFFGLAGFFDGRGLFAELVADNESLNEHGVFHNGFEIVAVADDGVIFDHFKQIVISAGGAVPGDFGVIFGADGKHFIQIGGQDGGAVGNDKFSDIALIGEQLFFLLDVPFFIFEVESFGIHAPAFIGEGFFFGIEALFFFQGLFIFGGGFLFVEFDFFVELFLLSFELELFFFKELLFGDVFFIFGGGLFFQLFEFFIQLNLLSFKLEPFFLEKFLFGESFFIFGGGFLFVEFDFFVQLLLLFFELELFFFKDFLFGGGLSGGKGKDKQISNWQEA